MMKPADTATVTIEQSRLVEQKNTCAECNQRNARLRTRLGLSQRELAQLVGSHAMTISKWERGTAKPPHATVKLLQILLADPATVMALLETLIAAPSPT